ncbi:Carbohydrate-binding X8 domain superfamily protein [Euphorbia peplus]|nr:Carbohydrate-binding X8 domain superfamily protein [Euphorbia peplus]
MASNTSTAFLLLFATVLLLSTSTFVDGQRPKRWCVAKKAIPREQAQESLDFACGAGIDCEPIKPNGACFHPNNVWSHASYAMNSYYQSKGKLDNQCDFKGTAEFITTDPSFGPCKYLSD